MSEITKIHEAVFQFLESLRERALLDGIDFFYTLRRSNQKLRLTEKYWFYGNEKYLAVSFWSGMDWKNKTPNIYFRVLADGSTYLTITTKDSLKKASYCKEFFIEPLNLKANGQDRWTKKFEISDYLESLESFINNEKKFIDTIIWEHSKSLISEDKENSIGFIQENDFKKWLENINSFRYGKENKFLPYALTDFQVKNYRPIEHAQFSTNSKNDQFIIIVGENGSGKSSLLKAIATAVGNKYYNENFDPENSAWIIDFNVYVNRRSKQSKVTKYDPISRLKINIPFVAFGPSRLITDSRHKRLTENVFGKDLTSPLYGLFFPDSVLRDINKWVLNELSSQNNYNAKLQYENIKQMLISIIPRLCDIREEEFGGSIELLYHEEDLHGIKLKQGVIYENLSSGIRSLIAMLGDMMVRLFEQQKNIVDPAQLAGIVLIDEIDIHLHPNWQRSVPKILTDNFPRIQFIVTTHSPIPLLGIPPNSSIFNISRTAAKGVYIKSLNYLNITNLLPNTILTSPIFGMDNLVSMYNKNIKAVNIDDSFEESRFDELLDKKMEELSKKGEYLNKKYFD